MIPKIKASNTISNKKISVKFWVSSNTKNGFFNQNNRLKNNANPYMEPFKKKFNFLKSFLWLVIKKQIKGKIINPRGVKK